MSFIGHKRFLLVAAILSWACFASALAARASHRYGAAQGGDAHVAITPGG